MVPKKTFLVTGAAGFIGSHTAQALLHKGYRVVGLDNFNDYYDPGRKHENVEEVRAVAESDDDFRMIEADIRDAGRVLEIVRSETFSAVIHLAAMAGVRISIENPELYYDTNVQGTLHLLDAARDVSLPQFVLASTSSVYGKTERIPFIEDDVCDRPISPYSASKRAAELLAFTYHHLFGLNIAIPRFFTVYGPRGRPDMMAYKVVDSIHFGKEVPLFNGGDMHRDWTYIDDIVAGVVAAAERPMGYEIFNLGRGEPVLLKDFVERIEALAGKKANLVSKPMMSADVKYTYADTSRATRLLDYGPKVGVQEGIERFWQWYQGAVLGK